MAGVTHGLADPRRPAAGGETQPAVPIGAEDGAAAGAATSLPADTSPPATVRSMAGRPGALVLRRRTGVFLGAIVEVLPAWLVARVVVLAALALAHGIVGRVRPGNAGAHLHVQQGLLTWDGGWYQSIAAHGYAASGTQSVRFFPAFPMAGRVLAWIPGIGTGPALVVLANLCSLAAMAALLLLVRADLGPRLGPDLARRSVWLLALAPAAYSLVLGYADGPLLLCSVVALYGVRSGRWWWAAGAGLVGGLVRPVGILLVVPAIVEVWRRRHDAATPAARLAQAAAVLGPVVGTGSYLLWVDGQFGDPWLPFRVQQQLGHRGSLRLPLPAMWDNLRSVLHGHHLGSAAHVPWVLLAVALLVLAFRRLPATYGAFTAAVLVVALASSNLDSFERYALGAFPLVVAASTLTERRPVELAVLGCAGAAMAGYATLAFLGMVVP